MIYQKGGLVSNASDRKGDVEESVPVPWKHCPGERIPCKADGCKCLLGRHTVGWKITLLESDAI